MAQKNLFDFGLILFRDFYLFIEMNTRDSFFIWKEADMSYHDITI